MTTNTSMTIIILLYTHIMQEDQGRGDLVDNCSLVVMSRTSHSHFTGVLRPGSLAEHTYTRLNFRSHISTQECQTNFRVAPQDSLSLIQFWKFNQIRSGYCKLYATVGKWSLFSAAEQIIYLQWENFEGETFTSSGKSQKHYCLQIQQQ